MGSSCRIECIFFSEFHPTLGPKITYQVPSTVPGLGERGYSLELSWLPGVVVGPYAATRHVIPFTDNLDAEDTQTPVSGS